MSLAESDTIDVAGDRAGWLAARRTAIGASEAAAALGLSPFETPLGLYLRKLGELPEVEETEAMRWGTRLEPLLAEAYAEATGRPVLRHQIFHRSGERPHLVATADGIDEAGDLVELKTLSAFKAGSLGDEDTDQLPDHWLCQAAQQCYVFGLPRVRFGVLVGGQRFRTFTVEWDDDVLAPMLAGLDAFWDRVERRDPPPADARDLAMLAAIRPAEGKRIALDDPAGDLASYADALEFVAREAGQLSDRRDDAKARLLEAMGDAAVATLPDGRELRRSVVTRKGYAVEPCEFVRFSVRQPKGGPE